LPSAIEQLYQEYATRGLAVVAVNMEESPDKVATWVLKNRVTVDVLLDPRGVASRAWAITATPCAFLFGRDGRLVARAVGRRPWTAPEGRAVIEALLRQ